MFPWVKPSFKHKNKTKHQHKYWRLCFRPPASQSNESFAVMGSHNDAHGDSYGNTSQDSTLMMREVSSFTFDLAGSTETNTQHFGFFQLLFQFVCEWKKCFYFSDVRGYDLKWSLLMMMIKMFTHTAFPSSCWLTFYYLSGLTTVCRVGSN